MLSQGRVVVHWKMDPLPNEDNQLLYVYYIRSIHDWKYMWIAATLSHLVSLEDGQ